MLNQSRTSLLALLLCSMVSYLAGSFSCLAAETKKEKETVKAVYTAEETKNFKALAQATIEAIDANKEKEMVAKITDLETDWDAKEATLKPKDEPTWTLIDKQLDKGISAIRSSARCSRRAAMIQPSRVRSMSA